MKILDTTIRDGSYAVDFKFSLVDVAEITEKLEKLNMDYIEIGHGQGLDASSQKYGLSLHTDIEYMDTAAKKLTHTPFGFFCIPGIARPESLRIAKEHGVSFVRVGVNADQVERAVPYIEEAKRNGLEVMANFMKSYIVTPEQFAVNAKIAEESGAECVYIVDSAGGMMPDELSAYYSSFREKCGCGIGFHGHNNLGLAVSNSVHCARLGFDIIDCSLQGLGRSLGNASTEMVVMTLVKLGYELDIDIPRLLEYGYVLLKDIKEHVSNPLDLVCGYADFHSSYLKDIYRCCNELNVDPLRLIIAYSKIDKRDMNYEKLCDAARTLPRDLEKNPYSFRKFFGREFLDA